MKATDVTWLVPLTSAQIRILSSALDSWLYESVNSEFDQWCHDGGVSDPRLCKERPLDDEAKAVVELIDEHDAVEAVLNDFLAADEALFDDGGGS